MEAYSAVIMEVFRERFIAAELLSYKEVLFVEATEDWYAQRDPVEVDWVESKCIRQAEQFAHLMEEYTERFFTYVLLQSPKGLTSHLESDQLEVDWITWHRNYAYNKIWGDSRTSIFNAIKCNL